MKKASFIILLFLLCGCSSYYEYDASIVAQDYCVCMRSKNPKNNPLDAQYAMKICDGLMLEKYYFFRCSKVTIGLTQSPSFNDSLTYFGRCLGAALDKKCCEFVGTCRDSSGNHIN
jgi:hypothetical protein